MRLAKYFRADGTAEEKLCASQDLALEWLRTNGRDMESFQITQVETTDPVSFTREDEIFLRECGIQC